MKPYYNMSIRPRASNVCAIAGKFTTRPGSDEIIVGKGEVLSLLSPDCHGEMNNLRSIGFGTSICSIAHPCSHEGQFILVGHNSGFLSVKITTGGSFEIKNRVNFDNPVHFLAADHQGRAVLAAPCKQNKIIYVVRNGGDLGPHIVISDSNTITYSVVALIDKDEKNVCFAAIEVNNCDPSRRHIAYYVASTDGGVLHVTRSTVSVDSEANHLLAVPGGEGGPGGILVITKHRVIFKKRGLPDVSTPLPGKSAVLEEHVALVVSATTCHVHKDLGISYLLQTEFGDIYRVSLRGGNGRVTGLYIKHIDTIPITYAMCILDSGTLFAASKTGNHALYRFSSTKLLRMDKNERILKIGAMELSGEQTLPLIFNLCSRGGVISLNKFSPWKKMGKIAETKLGARPNALWRVKNVQGRFESIAVSYDIGTRFMDMSIENGTQVILRNQKFDVNRPSLAVFTIGNGSTLQVHPKGIIQRQGDLQLPKGNLLDKEFVNVAYNRFQVVIAQREGKLRYYTVSTDQVNGKLEVRGACRMNAEVVCLCISPVPKGRNHSFCLAVGLADSLIKILVLEPRVPTEQVLQLLSVQTMMSPPESLLFLSPHEDNETLYHILIAGLENGLLTTMVMESSSGMLSVSCSRYMGSKPTKLFSVTARDQQAIICLSDRPYIGYIHQQNFLLAPLSCEAFEFAASICHHRPQGVVAVTADRMKLFAIEHLHNKFSENTSSDYTLENFALHPELELITVISKKGGSTHIMILDPRSGKIVSSSNLRANETAQSLCTVRLDNNGEYITLLAVGIGILESPNVGFIRIYRILEEGRPNELVLRLLQDTYVDKVPRALSQFKGALLVGIGPVLRMYDLEETILHKRCEISIITNNCVIRSINVVGDNIYVGDSKEAIHRFKYSTNGGIGCVFEYVNVPKLMSAFLQIDSSTMAWSDKLGNVFFVQFPSEVPNKGSEDPSSSSSSVNKVEEMCFHVGEVVTCLQNASSVPGGDEYIIYGTDSGTLGALLPLGMEEDAKLLSGLEKQMWRECPALCTRSPGKNEYPKNCVIDGDICEEFQTLHSGSQRSIAGKLGTTEIAILRKLGATRDKII